MTSLSQFPKTLAENYNSFHPNRILNRTLSKQTIVTVELLCFGGEQKVLHKLQVDKGC